MPYTREQLELLRAKGATAPYEKSNVSGMYDIDQPNSDYVQLLNSQIAEQSFNAPFEDTTPVPSVQGQMAGQTPFSAVPPDNTQTASVANRLTDILTPKDQSSFLQKFASRPAIGGAMPGPWSSGPITGEPEAPPAEIPNAPSMASAGAPMPSAAPMRTLNVGTGGAGSAENLANAQDLASQGRLQAGLSKSLDILGAGLTHAKPAGQELFTEQGKEAERPVEQLQQRIANEKNDPASPTSKAFRDYAGQFGVKIQGDFTAAMGEKLLPFIFKGYEADETRKAHHEDLKYKYQELQTIAKLRDTAHKDAKEEAAGVKTTTEDHKTVGDLSNKLNQARGRRDIQNALEADRLVTNALSIANKYPNPNDIPQNLVNFMTSEMTKLATGGVASHAEYKELSPQSVFGELQQKLSKWSGKPRGAQLGEFIKNNKSYLEDIQNNSKQLLANHFKRIINTNKSRLNDQSLLQPFVDEYKDVLSYLPDEDKKKLGMGISPEAGIEKTPGLPQGSVKIRQKSTGATKTLSTDAAAKYLQDPGFEQVQ